MEHDRKQKQPIDNSKPETKKTKHGYENRNKKHIKIRKKSEFSVLGSNANGIQHKKHQQVSSHSDCHSLIII